jgi:hypothetical protein
MATSSAWPLSEAGLPGVPRSFGGRRAEVKSLFSVLRTKFYFELHIIFEISLREISKMMCSSKQYFAACGGKILFGRRHLFSDFAKRNQKKDVSVQI